MKVSQARCFQITGHWKCYSIFFDISFIVFFTRLLSKVYEETFLFQLKFQKPISRCSILQKIRMFNFVILKWRPFEYKIKSLKRWDCFFKNKNTGILNFSWIKYFDNDFPFLIKWHIWVCYCSNYGPSNLKAEVKADFWLQIGIFYEKLSNTCFWTVTSGK